MRPIKPNFIMDFKTDEPFDPLNPLKADLERWMEVTSKKQ